MEDIKQLFVNELNEQGENQVELLEIFKTGSQILKDNPNDLDYVAVCRNYSKGYTRVLKKLDESYDLMIYDLDTIHKRLDFTDTTIPETAKLHNYLFCFREEKVFGNWEFNWDILNYKKEYLSMLKRTYYETVGKRTNRTKHTKGWVHYYIILKIYDNNKVEINEDMYRDINILYNSLEGTLSLISWIENKMMVLHNIKDI